MGYLDDLINGARSNAYNYVQDAGNPRPEATTPATTGWNAQNSDLSTLHSPTPQEIQDSLDNYKKQFGQLPPGFNTPVANASPDQGTMGPPAPTPEQATTKPSEVSPITSLMGKLNGNTGPSIQDILSKLNGPNPELKAAIDRRDRMQDLAMIGKGANQILGGQTHTTPSNAVWDEMSKNAGQGIGDIATKNQLTMEGLKQQDLASKLADEATKNDPNSSVSKLYRDTIRKMVGGVSNIPENISASALEKQFPAFEKIFAAAESARARAANSADLKSYREASLANRIDTSGQNTFNKETKDYTDRLENVGRFNKLVDEIRSGRLIDTHSISRTLTTDLSTLVNTTKAGGALTDRDEYALHTFQDLVSKIGQYAGKPVSAIPKEYLDQLDIEANALKNAIKSSYDRKTNELVQGTDVQGKKDIYKRRHDTFMDQYNQLPGGKGPQGQGNFDTDVIQYAKDHGLTNQQAQDIKNKRTQG